MTITPDLEIIDLSAHDFDTPCHHNLHEHYGTGAACWLVTLNYNHHCAPVPKTGAVCDGCLEYMKTTNKGVMCPCEETATRPYRNAIIHVEPLKK